MISQRQRWSEISSQDHVQYGEKFASIENKRSNRPDLHAFMLLDELFPGTMEIIAGAAHDEIFLGIYEEQIALLTDDQIIELIKCGVRYGEDCLCMFV